MAKKQLNQDIKDENTLRKELGEFFKNTKSLQDILVDVDKAEAFEKAVLDYKKVYEINKKLVIKKLSKR